MAVPPASTQRSASDLPCMNIIRAVLCLPGSALLQMSTGDGHGMMWNDGEKGRFLGATGDDAPVHHVCDEYQLFTGDPWR